jgi:hypothetical protein
MENDPAFLGRVSHSARIVPVDQMLKVAPEDGGAIVKRNATNGFRYSLPMMASWLERPAS